MKDVRAQADRHLESRWRPPFEPRDVAMPLECALNPAKDLDRSFARIADTAQMPKAAPGSGGEQTKGEGHKHTWIN